VWGYTQTCCVRARFVGEMICGCDQQLLLHSFFEDERGASEPLRLIEE
jgi:hypothetical protein